jgi:hypothetical protein
MDSGDYVALLGVIAGLIAFIVGLIQYVRAQLWKRAEFVAKEIKEFESKRDVQMTMQMLDWNLREFKLFPEKKPGEQKVLITDEILSSALVPHEERIGGFNEVEVCIRDIFDQFLDGLERFEHFIESGLVTHKEFYPYLIYWIKIIGDRNSGRKPPEFYDSFWKYLDSYGYSGVQKLLGRYGYII